MIQLTSTTDLVRVVTSGAAAYSVDVYAAWSDVPKSRSAVTPWPPPGTVSLGRSNTEIASAATTTIVTSPSSTAQREVSTISIRNTHATIACTVSVEHTDGTTVVTLWQGEVAASESVMCTPSGVWMRYGVDGSSSGGGLTDLELRASPVPVDATISGEIIESLEAMRMAMQSMLRMFGGAYPDVGGRLRVAIDAITASLTLATITTVGTVTTVSTVTSMTTLANQTNIGGISAAPQVPALTMIAAESLRRNISVS